MTLGQHSRQEILSQGQAWQSALDAVAAQTDAIAGLFRRNASRDLLFVACGSPYFLGLSMAAHAQTLLKTRARSVPSSDLLFFPDGVLPPGPPPLVVTLSRSGETSETIAAVRAMRARGSAVLAIGCDAQTTLLKLADVAVEVAAGREKSVAQTRSFSGMMLAAQATIAVAAGDRALLSALQRLPALAESYVGRVWQTSEQIVAQQRPARIFYLGAGTRYGLACEATLKMKEMSISHAEAFHTLEFRHGPMSLVDDQTLVVGLISEKAAEAELAVLREMRQLGARTLAIGESAAKLAGTADTIVAFDSGLPAEARDLLYLPAAQALAFHQAASKGVDCDNPRNLVAYVTLPDLG